MENPSKTSFFSFKRGLFLLFSILFVVVFYLVNPYSIAKPGGQSENVSGPSNQTESPRSKVDSSEGGSSIKILKFIEIKNVLGELKEFADF